MYSVYRVQCTVYSILLNRFNFIKHRLSLLDRFITWKQHGLRGGDRGVGGGIQEASFIETIVLNMEFFNNLVCTVSPKNGSQLIQQTLCEKQKWYVLKGTVNVILSDLLKNDMFWKKNVQCTLSHAFKDQKSLPAVSKLSYLVGHPVYHGL